AAGVDRAGLERRDLRHVEHIEDVDARARDLDSAEAVDREVAERVRLRGDRREQRRREADDERDPLHASALRATGVHSSEKRGFSLSARANHARAASRWPRHCSISPRWKYLTASLIPRPVASFEYLSASTHCPFRASAQASTSSPSIDGRSACAWRASASDACSRMPWSTSKSAVSRSVLTPFATSRRWITEISAYCRPASFSRPLAWDRSRSIETYCGSGILFTAWCSVAIAAASLPSDACARASASSANA